MISKILSFLRRKPKGNMQEVLIGAGSYVVRVPSYLKVDKNET